MKKFLKKMGVAIGLTSLLSTQAFAMVVIPKGNPATYTDIEGHWAEEAMRYVVTEGYFKGVTTTSFAPEDETSRAMICAVLWRLTGDELTHITYDANGERRVVPNYVKMFWDMKDNDWYTNYISWANKKEIISGYSKREFRPEEAVTREQLSVILNNYLKNYRHIRSLDPYIVNDVVAFTDEGRISDWAKEAVSKMQQVGLMTGRPDGSFDPQGTVTRAEVATVLQRFVKIIK